jgi:hypothetical protein
MMFIEMAAYVGDILSFYQDMQLQETYIQYAKDPVNLYNLAYMMGYVQKLQQFRSRYRSITPCRCNSGQPDWSQALQIPAGTQLSSATSGQSRFYIDTPVDFTFSSSYDPTEVVIETLDSGQPLPI